MNYRRLGSAGLKLSEFSLGSWVTFGTQVDVDLAVACMTAAYDAGVNFFDNAESYDGGRSEVIMGQVLFSDTDSQLFLYTPAGSAPNLLRPRVEGIKYNGGGVFTLSGQQLNGQNAGSNYGGDVETDQNYPIVSLTDKAGHVFYARSSNWRVRTSKSILPSVKASGKRDLSCSIFSAIQRSSSG